MTTPTQTSSVVGHALYLEFVKTNSTTQLLIMPEAVSSTHATVPVVIYRRRMTPGTRKTWRTSSAHSLAQRNLVENRDLAKSPAMVDKVLYPLGKLLESLKLNEYTLYKEPIVVEVTSEDVEQARLGRTPYKVMSRVFKVRKALGFPKEIVHVTTSAPTF